MEKTSTGFCWGSRVLIPLEVTYDSYDCIRRRPDFLFCCFIEVTYDIMTVVKSVSDGLRD
jgi:hypothetical protein